jgi:hypothetical protein
MSRRHHGNRPPRLGPPRSADPARAGGEAPSGLRDDGARPARPDAPTSERIPPAALGPIPAIPAHPRRDRDLDGAPGGRAREIFDAGAAANGSVEGGHGTAPNGAPAVMPASAGCTAPQLRRFIKSRPYVPMHELRRRFGINGGEDDVSAIDLGDHRVFVGLPAREGSLLGELLRGGDIGYELSLDPRTPIVVGLYPMRPVARS